MNPQNEPRKSKIALLVALAFVIIVLDQITKAWFVYQLGRHHSDSFDEFCLGYFRLWVADPQGSGIIDNYFPFSPPISVYQDWIQFNLTTNNGAAWSIFANNSFVLSFVSLVMAGILYYIWSRHFRTNTGMTWALGGIIGGALGNFIDRFRLKEVVDFIDVKIPFIGRLFEGMADPYDFPIFNVADSAAVCGTLALAIYLIVVDITALSHRMHDRNKPKAPPPFPESHGLDYDPDLLTDIRRGKPSDNDERVNPDEEVHKSPAPESDWTGVESDSPAEWLGPPGEAETEDGSKRARESAED